MESKLLENLDQSFSKGDYGYIDSMLILKSGKRVYESSYEHDYAKVNKNQDTGYRYYNTETYPYYKDTKLHTLQSVTKSITSPQISEYGF